MTDSARTVLHNPREEEFARKGWYLHSRDRFVARQVLKAAGGRKPGELKILDAGCGTGGVVHLLTQAGCKVTGADADAQSLEWGRAQGRLTNYVCAGLEHLSFDDDSFDLGVSSEVLEHLADDAAGLRELFRVCRGPVVLTVPAHRYLWTDSDALLLHQRRYSRRAFAELIESAGGSVESLRPFGMIPGLAILAYKVLARLSRRGKTKNGDMPLAARYSVPPFLNRLMAFVFSVDLRLSQMNLIPWGHAWIAVARRKTREENKAVSL